MRRLMMMAAIAFYLAVPEASAQQKIKDEGLHQYLIQEFARLSERLDKLNDRVVAIENRLSQLEKGQAGLAAGQAQTETLLKSSDTSLSSLRLNTQQELFELKAGIVDLKTTLAQMDHAMSTVMEAVKKGGGGQQAAAPSVASALTGPPVGYLDTSDAANWTINLGTGDNVHSGQQFHVYHLNSNDGTEGEAGIVEVVEVAEAHRSRVKVISSKPDVKIDFGDIVRTQ